MLVLTVALLLTLICVNVGVAIVIVGSVDHGCVVARAVVSILLFCVCPMLLLMVYIVVLLFTCAFMLPCPLLCMLSSHYRCWCCCYWY